MTDDQGPAAPVGEPPSGSEPSTGSGPPTGSAQAPRAGRGRHRGDSAAAPRRATRPATNAPTRLPAHRAEPGAAGPSRPPADAVVGPSAADPSEAEPVLPRSKDDLDVGWGGSPDVGGADDDERFLREVPPHWQ